MEKSLSMQDRIGAISELHERLRKAFDAAERVYLPSTFNPVRVAVALSQLVRAGHLRWFEIYPVYAVLTASLAVLYVFSHQWFYFPLYVSSIPMAVFTWGKYLKEFVRYKANLLNLPPQSFGVPNLSLHILGLRRLFCTELDKRRIGAVAPASLTKSNLASVIKLIKAAHDHGEVSIGFHDAIKKAAIGGLFSLPLLIQGKLSEIVTLWNKFVVLAQSKSPFAPGLIGVFAIGSALFGIYLLVDPVIQKKRRRRYLLALSTMHECWEEDPLKGTSADVPGPCPEENVESAEDRDALAAVTLLVGADRGHAIPIRTSSPVA